MSHDMRALSQLRPHSKNYRAHSNAQLKAYAESLRQFGQQRPVVILPDGTILSGHGLVEAARLAGMDDVWVTVYDRDNPEGYLVADNRVHQLGGDNTDALADLLSDLAMSGKLEGTGYDDDALLALFSDEAEPSPPARHARDGFKISDIMGAEDASELLAPVHVGETWRLGRHAITAMDASTSVRHEGDAPYACVWTDPPYDAPDWPDMLTRALARDALPLTDAAVLCCAIPSSKETATALWSLARAGWDVCQIACWTAPRGASGPVWSSRHRLFALGVPVGASYPQKQGNTVWAYRRATVARYYPDIMPFDLVRDQLRSLCGDPPVRVYDPFGGYGTTLLACDALGYDATLIESNPERVRIAIALWEAETGLQAVRESAERDILHTEDGTP